MNPSQAQISTKSINSESMSLTPSALITLFEVDISDIAFSQGLSSSISVFRFHNNIKLTNNNIFWQGNEYIAAPIFAQGFEVTSKGTLPVPKLSISVNDAGIILLSSFKAELAQLNDLVGAKVTRIRTFAKFLDANNFSQNSYPPSFSPDPNAEFPRDIYYIDRKVAENKYNIQFEMASLLDTEGIKLPARLVLAERCVWSYRGEGCQYAGIPVADYNNQKILEQLNISSINQRGLYDSHLTYNIGDSVYLIKDSIQYHFVANQNTVISSPPNPNYWIADECSKLLAGCRLRFNGILPTSAFEGANRVQ